LTNIIHRPSTGNTIINRAKENDFLLPVISRETGIHTLQQKSGLLYAAITLRDAHAGVKITNDPLYATKQTVHSPLGMFSIPVI